MSTLDLNAVGPLSPQQQAQLTQANRAAAEIVGRPARFAAFNAAILAAGFFLSALWALICIAMDLLAPHGLGGGPRPSLGSVLMVDLSNIVIAGLLAAFAWNEKRGRALLLEFQPRGAALLRTNQYAIFGFVALYCLWAALSVDVSEYAQLNEALGGNISKDIANFTRVTYGAVALITGVVQYLLAVFYGRTFDRLSTYVAQTPPWIIIIQRSFSR
jgi:hypothetical protein